MVERPSSRYAQRRARTGFACYIIWCLGKRDGARAACSPDSVSGYEQGDGKGRMNDAKTRERAGERTSLSFKRIMSTRFPLSNDAVVNCGLRDTFPFPPPFSFSPPAMHAVHRTDAQQRSPRPSHRAHDVKLFKEIDMHTNYMYNSNKSPIPQESQKYANTIHDPAYHRRPRSASSFPSLPRLPLVSSSSS